MLNALRWLAKVLATRPLQPAYAYALAPRSRAALAMFALVAAGQVTATAQVADNRLKEMGLDAMWRTQLQMPIEAGKIVSTHLWTNPDSRKVYAELTVPAALGMGKRTFRVSAETLGADGKPIGMEAAKHEAEIRAARLLGRSAGIPAIEVSVPMIYLIVVSSDGLVQAMDAETGEMLWKNSCGPVGFPAAPSSISDAGLLVAHGPEMYLLDLKTGEHLAKRKMERASTAGVAMVGSIAFVSSLSGQTEVFDFSRAGQGQLMRYRLFGRTISPPSASDRNHNLVAFSTDKGIATVLNGGEKVGPWFNVRSKFPLSGPLTFIGGGLYLSDVMGQVSKVKLDRTGAVIWRMMIGEALGAPPMVVNKVFYATNEVGDLINADDETGFPIWTTATPRVKSILAGTQERLYCRSLTDRLLVVDTKNGKVLYETGSDVIGTTLVNHLNDRLYLISSSGVVQAAHQSGKDYILPVFHEPLPAATATETAKPTTEAPASMEPAAEATDADPFGAATGTEPMAPADASDPFAVPATPPAAGMNANPF